MIPTAYITEWQQVVPWSQPTMVEQDLVICKVLLELYGNEQIAQHAAFRGGTALYKLYLLPAARYSEDIDLVQIDAEPIGPTLDIIRSILDPWLGKPKYDAREHSYRLTYRFQSDDDTPIRLKIEINTREHIGQLVSIPFTIDSRWYSGSANITTFPLYELLGTKLRALYQRRKGRDLFDLEYALLHADVDPEQIVSTFVKYVTASKLHISTSEFVENLQLKCEDQQFCQDVVPMLRTGLVYDAKMAAEKVTLMLLARIDTAWSASVV